MIHYALQCSRGHGFDGWYKDSAAFEKLAAAGLVDCPACGDTRARRALMAPAIGKGQAEVPVAAPEPAPAPPAPAEPPPGPMPAQMMAVLQRMRAEVEKTCDHVGDRFAEEARRMHRGESDRRGIYGHATETEAEALRDEGIEVGRIPWVPRADG